MHASNACMRKICVVLLLCACVSLFAEDIPLQNWPVPSAGSRGSVASNADMSNATTFVAVTPCRLLDTRNPAGPFGGPAFGAGETRTYDVPAGPCTGLPNGAAAYSLNFTIVNYNVGSGSFVTAYPASIGRPGVSTVNFGSGPPIANASVVAGGGLINVYAGAATDLIVDLNGYFIGTAGTLNAGKTLTLTGSVPDGGIISGRNQTTTSAIYTTGVLGTITTTNLTDGSGVMGYTTGGTTWGVKGWNSWTGFKSGGVLGLSGNRVGQSLDFNAAGVRGESQFGFGVLGLTSTAHGVAGVFVNSQGTPVRGGYLGGATYGVYADGDFAASGTKAFVDPHPTEAGKVIRFISLEGPEAGTYFRGRGKFTRGKAVIEVPEAFRLVSEEEGMTVHVTPIGGLAMVAVIRQSLERIDVEASKDVEFAYVVHGVRRGYRGFEPIANGDEFTPKHAEETIPASLNEEQKRRLVQNGTYNADGTVNLETAVRLGWEKGWERERQHH